MRYAFRDMRRHGAGCSLDGAPTLVPVQPADIPAEGAQPQIPFGERVAANDFYDAHYDGGYGVHRRLLGHRWPLLA